MSKPGNKLALPVILAVFILVSGLLSAIGCSNSGTEDGPAAATPQNGSPPPAAAPPQSSSPAPQPSADTPFAVTLEPVAEGLAAPVEMVQPPDMSGRFFIVDQIGIIKILTSDGRLLPQPFLDIRDRMVKLNADYDERGLLGLAFHPGYIMNGRFYVYYSAPLRDGAPAGWDHTSHISEFRAAPPGGGAAGTGDMMAGGAPAEELSDIADPNSERIILQIDQPQANHNGGQLVYNMNNNLLYIASGDGGAANDAGLGHAPGGNGQDINSLLGKILRIDPDAGDPYGIPPENPFVGEDGADEIYAFGFRNPFRFSFDDNVANDLYVADVGQNLWEEVDIVVPGGNYGWPIKEGAHFFNQSSPNASLATGPSEDAFGNPLIDPVIEYSHSGGVFNGTAVIGGFLYHGGKITQLQNKYVFGDFTVPGNAPDGRLFMAAKPAAPGKLWEMKEIFVKERQSGRLNAFIKAFARDVDLELYVLTSDNAGPSGETGKVYKIMP